MSKQKKVKKPKTKKPMRTKSTIKADVIGNWTPEEDDLLLNTNSNNVAALLLKRSRESSASRRFVLRTKFNKESVRVEPIGVKKAKSIVAKIMKQKRESENGNEKRETILLDYNPSPIENLPSPSYLLLNVNDQEILIKNGVKKLTIKGENISFSIE